MDKHYFYRGYIIIKNKYMDNGMKWTTFEDDELYANTLDEMKNKIDKLIGGHPTARIPKRTNKKI